MAGSSFGKRFVVTTWGESHGAAIGVVVDGVPAGLSLAAEDVQSYLDRRKPGQSKYTTARKEDDAVEILSGVFEGQTTGTPISMLVRNADHHSADYSNIKETFRPGHADYTYFKKYGLRDYRGGGRSSARETIGRVAAGAIAGRLLAELGITACAYTRSIGPYEITHVNMDEIGENPLNMPDTETAAKAQDFLNEAIEQKDSAGGVVECVIRGVPAGLGEPVFDKLDAELAKAMLSIGAVKGFAIGDGFAAAKSKGSENNDGFTIVDGQVKKLSNHAGGVLGGISDGSEITFRVALKPTPSIAQEQQTVTEDGKKTPIVIHGRHDPVVVPRAVVVVEAMANLVLADALLSNMTAKMEYLRLIYQ